MIKKPKQININEEELLHNDGGPAIEWEGLGIYQLNGVSVPQWMAVKRAEDIDPQQLFTLNNAEVRREFVRKVGIDRILHKCNAKVIDKEDGRLFDGQVVPMYELLELELDDCRPRYLKMINASLSLPDNFVYHVEGVDKNCDTVEDALLFRMNGGKLDNFYRFIQDGSDWWIHGDVIIVPEGVRNLKREPVIIA